MGIVILVIIILYGMGRFKSRWDKDRANDEAKKFYKEQNRLMKENSKK